MTQTSERFPRTSPRLDERSVRSAQIRAVAARLVDSPRMARRFHVPAGVPLVASTRRRRTARPGTAPRHDATRRRSPVVRRVIAAAVLVVQVVGLVVLLTAPAFKVHTVTLTGAQLLSRQSLLTTAAVPQTSVFAVDSAAIRSRLTRMSWVRDVQVSTQLPSTVVIDVTEWTPDVVYHDATGTAFVAPTGATLTVDASDVGRVGSYPIAVDERSPAPGLSAGMPGLLAAIAQRWHGLFGTDVAGFAWSSSGVLSIWSANGWAAVIGSTDTSDEVNAIPAQVAALAALRGRVDFASPAFGYINLENPAQPALGGKPGIPADVKAAIAAASTLTPTAAPGPAPLVPHPADSAARQSTSASGTAAPTAPPSPTPFSFSLPPPSPAARAGSG